MYRHTSTHTSFLDIYIHVHTLTYIIFTVLKIKKSSRDGVDPTESRTYLRFFLFDPLKILSDLCPGTGLPLVSFKGFPVVDAWSVLHPCHRRHPWGLTPLVGPPLTSRFV